jgi:hypothetical protein
MPIRIICAEEIGVVEKICRWKQKFKISGGKYGT